MLSFSKKISFFNTKHNWYQKRLHQQSPKNFELSLQKAAFKNVKQLYEHVFDMLIQESNEEFDQETNEKPLLFCHIGDDILKITLNTSPDSFSSIYNRLLKYRYPSERQLIKIEEKKNKFKGHYKHLSSNSKLINDKNSDDDAITKKIKNLENQYKEVVKKIAKMKNELASSQISMIEFLVDVRIALKTLPKNDPLVLYFNNICDKIFNDDNSKIKSTSQISNSSSQEKTLTRRESFYSKSVPDSGPNQSNRTRMMEFY